MTPVGQKRIYEICPDHIKFPDQWFLDEPLTSSFAVLGG
jgi:hypothetical protein